MNFLEQIHARRDAALKANVCAICGQEPDLDTFSPAGKAEWSISATCEPCFDDLFPPEPDE
jgi:hypothetical protein